MKTLTLSTEQFNNDTIVSNVFLDRYMCDANGEFVKVYLYLLRSMTLGNVGLSDIADRLNLTEKDVVRALRYWDTQNVLKVTFTLKTNRNPLFLLTLIFLQNIRNSKRLLLVPLLWKRLNPQRFLRRLSILRLRSDALRIRKKLKNFYL